MIGTMGLDFIPLDAVRVPLHDLERRDYRWAIPIGPEFSAAGWVMVEAVEITLEKIVTVPANGVWWFGYDEASGLSVVSSECVWLDAEDWLADLEVAL